MRTLLTLVGGIAIGVAVAHFWLGPVDWSGVGEQTVEVVSDTATGAAVRAALALQKDFELFGSIEVRAEDGVVTLSGTVATDEQRQLAVLIARGVEGVEEVINELEIAGQTGSHAPRSAAGDGPERPPKVA